jgi:hypothetical protein
MANLVNKKNLTENSRSEKDQFLCNDLIRLTYENGTIIEKVFSIKPVSEYKNDLQAEELALGILEEGETISDDDERLANYTENLSNRINGWMEKI